LNQLATFWLNGDTVLRKAITAACHAIDLQLQEDHPDET
jgi:hypothetical protein